MKYTKEDIVREYTNLRGSLGVPPSASVFFKETGIHKRHLDRVFGGSSFSKLVLECGDSPQKFSKPKSDIEGILIQWGNLARMLDRLPTMADWTFNNCQPTADGITKSHNIKWTDLSYKFIEYFSGKEE